MKDLLILALKSLSHRRLRSFITIVGIVIGITSIVTLVSVSKGFQASAESLLEEFGGDNIIITGGKGLFTSSIFAPVPLRERDLRAVQRVPGVTYASGIAARTLPVKYRGRTVALLVYGMERRSLEEMYGKMMSTYIEDGRIFRSDDSKEAMIGYTVAHEVFGTDITPGRAIEINGVRFRVVGVLRRVGSSRDDLSVTIPLKSLREISSGDDYVMILAKAAIKDNVNRLAEKIKRRLKEIRGKEDFTVQSSEDLLNQINSILTVISIIVLGVAAISIFVGGIGIMNTMYMSVTERIREIGVMKAVGATRGQIMAIFLLEAGMIGVIGGVLGTVIAVALAKVAEVIVRSQMGLYYYSVYLGPEVIVGALLFSFLIGILSGLLPARRAASLDPAKALRYE